MVGKISELMGRNLGCEEGSGREQWKPVMAFPGGDASSDGTEVI